ncbi:MAG: hypothetical protein ABW224_11390 [Kibdelosporangium sp.]
MIIEARGRRRGRRSIFLSGGIASAAAVVAVLIAVPAVLTSSGPAAAVEKCMDPRNDDTAMRKCLVTELLTAELPAVHILTTNVQDQQDEGRVYGYRVTASMTNPTGLVYLEVWQPPHSGAQETNTCDRQPDCIERIGPHGEPVVILTMPNQSSPEGETVFVVAAVGNTTVKVYTTEEDRTKRLLDVDAMIRIVTTPQLLP